MRGSLLVAGLAATTLVLSACGGGVDSNDSSSSGSGGPLKVGLAYDIGGRGDQSFNDSAAAGLDEAKSSLGVEVSELEATQGESDADKAERLRTLADGGATAIIAVGFAYSEPVTTVAGEYPDIDFAIVDDAAAQAPNLTNIVFAEEQGSFLVGAAAALKTTSGTVGFVGGVQTPLIEKFEAGYKAGVEAAKPGTRVVTQYLTQPPDFTGFSDPSKGRTAAQGLLDQGADVIYQAAGGSGAGVFEAVAAKPGSLAIGVDSDQYKTADPSVRDVILTSMVKNVNVGVLDFVKAVSDGTVKAGVTTYDLANGGVAYSTSGGKVDDIVPQLDMFSQQIQSGQITVPTTV
ncbi:BMP family ABC transporter substrate-binding protein [Rhodococcus aerolatus]